jgi:hypothetical protein
MRHDSIKGVEGKLDCGKRREKRGISGKEKEWRQS